MLRWIAARVHPDAAPAIPLETARRARSPVGATGKRCSNARLRATGYRLRYPTFREGYAELLGGA